MRPTLKPVQYQEGDQLSPLWMSRRYERIHIRDMDILRCMSPSRSHFMRGTWIQIQNQIEIDSATNQGCL